MGFRDKLNEGRATRRQAAQNWKRNIEKAPHKNGIVGVSSLQKAHDAYDEETKDLPWYAR